jgi:prepilin-type N-terminal cleavage/methylation domain-containing protein/prepilin-type processing-associated H-X9-DG protein
MKKKAFTLIELLVVIAIIALLLSILMPSLRKVKKQAQAVVCMSNLKQWGVVWSLYLEDNKNKFPIVTDRATDIGVPYIWVEPLRPYYKGGGEDMRVCPTATKSEAEGGRGWFIAWDDPGTSDPPEEYRGSYGINNWLYGCPNAKWWGNDTTGNWLRADVKGANRIPLFMDCWRWGGSPLDTDEPYTKPPQVFEDLRDADFIGSINRFCLDRHSGNINILFVDMAVSKVGLKQLWKVKWKKDFDVNGPWTKSGGVTREKWPDWMKGLSE